MRIPCIVTGFRLTGIKFESYIKTQKTYVKSI